MTIATNMAGRGVDIKIDDEIRALGGLYIIGIQKDMKAAVLIINFVVVPEGRVIQVLAVFI